MRHITVIGRTGQLGQALRREAALSGVEINSLARAQCDLSGSSDDIEVVIDALPATDVIIIAAAYTAVDAAETHKDLALAVNGVAPGAIGRAAQRRKIPVVHISTDYVFNGENSSPYKIDHKVEPINYYGESKAQGEKNLFQSQLRSAVLRTSWVYDGTGKNFLTTMLRLAQLRTELSVVDDQIGRPTYAGDLAKATLRAADALIENKPGSRGVFHVSNSGDPLSWADFAREIFDQFKSEIGHDINVIPIQTASYPTPAPRPAWSVMDISHFEDIFDMPLPHWRDGLRRAALERL